MSTFDLGNLTGSQNYLGAVDSNNPFDLYKFNLSGTGSFKLTLGGLSNNADLEFLNSKGEVLSSSNASGTNSEEISIDNFIVGADYFARVVQVSGVTKYSLDLNFIEKAKEYNPNSQVDPLTGLQIESGYFTVGEAGKVGVDFVFDGGWYKGELAVFSLEELDKFDPGSAEFIKEAAKRSLSNSPQGYVVISDATEDAKASGGLGDGNYNDSKYLGIKTFDMKPGDKFGFMLVPNGTVQQVFNDPNIGGDIRPLFSLVTANPNQAFHTGQIADFNGAGSVFVMEDRRVDTGSDKDYNDIIFKVIGATGLAVKLDEVINPAKDWRSSEQGKKFIDSLKPESPIDPKPPVDPTPPVDPKPPVDPTPIDPKPPVDPTPPIDQTPPVDPTPVDPKPPVDPTPIDPTPVDPKPPVDPTPIDPTPVDPKPPVDQTPIDPTPVDPKPPVDQTPIDSTPVDPKPPVDPTPIDSTPPIDPTPSIDRNQPLIGIIDTGFSGNNPDIDYRRVVLGSDRIDNDNNPLLSSGEGNQHGTHILGLIAAIQDNGIGIDGINDQAQIWLGRAVGSGGWADSLIEFVDAARASGQRNAVVNLSLDLTQVNSDGSVTTRYEFTPKERQAIEYARQNHVVIVTAAGNDGGVMSVLGQASQEFDNIITVGASNEFDRANYSSYGAGLDILTEGGTIDRPVISTVGNSLGKMAGTSVAAARVTGVASLVWAANPDLNFKQVIQILESTATDLKTPGWDGDTGFGLLNSAAAIELAKKTVGESYTPEAWVTPFIWDGEGKVTPIERAAQGGNSIATATQFSPTFSDNDKVDSTTPEKYYQFTVNQSGYVRWTLTRTNGSNEFPGLSLIKADGTPGRFKFVPGGAVISVSVEGQATPNSTTDGVFVDPGTYYLKLRGGANNSVRNYNLSNQFIPDSVSTFQTPISYSTAPYFDFYPDLQSKAFNGIAATGLNVSGEVEYKFADLTKRTAKYGLEVKEPGKLNLNLLSPNGKVEVRVEKFIGSENSTAQLAYYTYTPNSNYWDEITLNKGRYQIEVRASGDEATSIEDILKLPYTLTGVFSRLAPKPGEGNVPIAAGNFIKTVTSNGVDTHYYNNGYLTVQPKGYSTWYTYGTGNPIPEVSISVIPIEAPPDYAGNKLGTARDLGNLGLNVEISYSVGARDFVGDVDKYDYYRFNFNQNNTFKLGLQDLSADAKVELIQDRNNNGQVDFGEVLESTAGGTAAQFINRTPLQNGIYYVRVSSNKAWADTNYSLDLTALAIPTDTIKKYSFQYYYGNGTFLNGQYTGGGDWYRGYFYAKDGSYFKDQIIAQQTFNSSGNKGFYKITDAAISGSSSDLGKVYITSYSDNDSSKGIFTPAYNVNYALSNQGLGTEYDYIGTQLFNKGVELDLGDNDGNNSMSTAEFLTLNQTNVGKSIGGGIDREDYYRFSLNQISDVNIQMYGMTAKVGFEVIKDLNNNGRVDSNEKLNISRASTTHQSLNTTFSPGNYYICVFPENPNDLNGKTNYNLFVSATPEIAGNTLGKAYNVGVLNNYKNFTGFLRTDHDTDDYYRFELNRPSNFNLKLEGVNTTQLGGVGIDGGTPNTLVQLIRDINNNGQVDPGEVLQSSSGNPTTKGAINTSLEPGNYFVRVSPDTSNSVNTSYNLNLYAEARPIALDRWNASFINRDPGNVADFNSYNFSYPAVVLDLGSQTNGDGKIRLYKDFGFNSPAPNVQSDYFAMEASTITRLDAGKLYKVTTKSDDGTQFFLTKVASATSTKNLEYFGGWSSGDWRDRGASEPEKTIYFKVPESGDYVFDVQYYEKGLESKIDVTLEETKPFEEPTDGSKWRSSVFWWDRNQGDKPPTDFWIDGNNLMGVLNQGSSDLGGGKKGINFDWGNGSANNDPRLPGDNFAIRSYTHANFEAGKKYRFSVRGDDGFQILAKNWDLPENDPNKWVYITPKDQWQQSYGDTVYEFTLPENAPSGGYDLHFHYYEQGVDANFNLSWAEVSSSSGGYGFDIDKLIASVPYLEWRDYAKQSIPLIVDECKASGITDLGQIAYILATSEHESHCGQLMRELWGPTPDQLTYDGRLGNDQPGDGYRYRGRGYTQITGKGNYRNWSTRLGIDLVSNPEKATEPEIAAKIIVQGMRDGTFTQAKLSDYINSSQQDFFNARDIVNGDKYVNGQSIAEMAQRYLDILKMDNSESGNGSPFNGLPSSAAQGEPFFKCQFYDAKYNPGQPSSTGNCGPASLAMVIEALGLEPPNLSIQESIDRASDLMNRPRTAVDSSWEQLETGVRNAGGTPENIDNWDSLDLCLAEGKPVLANGWYGPNWRSQFPSYNSTIGTRDPNGVLHLNAILGKTPEGKYIVADPMYRGGPVEMRREQLAVFFQNNHPAYQYGKPAGIAFARNP
jgi:Subtilase family/Domain of unknown function (DUF4114)